MSKGLAKAKNQEVTPEKVEKLTIEDITKYLCPTASPKEAGLFLKICQVNNLNPFKKEAYLIKYGTKVEMVTGYEVYLKRAERSGTYGGFKCWTEGSTKDGNLKACIDIYRTDWAKPFYHEVYFEECNKGNPIWQQRPRGQLKKTVTSQAFRLAWPEDVGGLPYTADEIQGEIVEAKEPVPQPEALPESVAGQSKSDPMQKFESTKEEAAKLEEARQEHEQKEAEIKNSAIPMSTSKQQQSIHINATKLWGKKGNETLIKILKKHNLPEHTKELTFEVAKVFIKNQKDAIQKQIDLAEKAAEEEKLKENLLKKPVKTTNEFAGALEEAFNRGEEFLESEVGMPRIHPTSDEAAILNKLADIEPEPKDE